jgi:hypothetical protein
MESAGYVQGFLEEWTDWWAPSTDSRVLIQALALVALFSTVAFGVRKHRELLTLVAGIATLTAGLFLLRAVH